MNVQHSAALKLSPHVRRKRSQLFAARRWCPLALGAEKKIAAF